MIVCSILLAFGIDAWWHERSDRVRLAAALDNVVAEVSVGRSEIDAAVQSNRERIAGLNRFLTLAPDGIATLPQDSVLAIATSFAPPRPFDPGGSALESLLAGGNLEILGDDDLARALIAWARFPDEIDDDHRMATSLTLALLERTAPHGIFLALAAEGADQVIEASKR